MRTPGDEQGVRLASLLEQDLVEPGQAGGRGEQALAKLALADLERRAAHAKALVVEPVGGLVRVPVDAAEHAREDLFVERIASGGEQRVLATLAANDGERLAARGGEHGTDAHLVHRVAVLASIGDAEQKADDGAPRRALARLVRSEDDLDAAVVVEAQRLAAEGPEGCEVERADAH